MFVRHHIKESENYRYIKGQPLRRRRFDIRLLFATETHWNQVPWYEGNFVPIVSIILVLVGSGGPRLSQSPRCEGYACEIEENSKKP